MFRVSALLPEEISPEERAFIAQIQPYLNPARINEPVNDDKMTWLHVAAYKGFNSALIILLQSGACVDVKDKGGCPPMYYAIWNDHPKIADLLITHGSDVNPPIANDGLTILHYAAGRGNTKAAALLIGRGAKVDVEDSSGATPMSFALGGGHAEIIDLLKANGVDINASVNDLGQTLLLIVSAKGDTEAAALLIAKGAHVDTKDKNGETAISLAAWIGNPEMVDLLKANGADIDAPLTDGGLTALHCAAAKGNTQAASLLIAKGARVDIKDISGNTPMCFAVLNAHPEIVDLLQVNGVDINATIYDASITLLHQAAIEGNIKVATLLISKGARLDAKTKGGCTPMYYAIWNGHPEIVDLLKAHGVDINTPLNDHGITLLHQAAIDGNIKAATLLISKGARLDVKDKGGCTPMFYAVWENQPEMVDLLKAKGVDINTPLNDHGITLLHQAAIDGNIKVATLLIAKGARVESEDKLGRTLIFYGVFDGQPEIVDLLIANGVDINAPINVAGDSLLDLAKSEGLTEAVELLIAKGAVEHVEPTEGTADSSATSAAVEVGSVAPAAIVVTEVTELTGAAEVTSGDHA